MAKIISNIPIIRNITHKSFIPELGSFSTSNNEISAIKNPKTPIIILGISFLFCLNSAF